MLSHPAKERSVRCAVLAAGRRLRRNFFAASDQDNFKLCSRCISKNRKARDVRGPSFSSAVGKILERAKRSTTKNILQLSFMQSRTYLAEVLAQVGHR
jgi:hypothetical protein